MSTDGVHLILIMAPGLEANEYFIFENLRWL